MTFLLLCQRSQVNVLPSNLLASFVLSQEFIFYGGVYSGIDLRQTTYNSDVSFNAAG